MDTLLSTKGHGFTSHFLHCSFTAFAKSMMSCIHHYSIMRKRFSALTPPPVLHLRILFFPPTTPTNDLFTVQFHLSQNAMHLKLYSMEPFHAGFFHLAISICSLCVFLWFDNSFLFRVECYSIAWVYHKLFMHLPTEGHLRCLQVLANVNKADLKICAQVFMWT